MQIHRRLLLSLFLTALIGPLLPAQVPAGVRLEGGSFEIDGERVEVTAEQLGRHYELLRGLNPDSTHARLLELAWARAIRTEGARRRGLTVAPEPFAKWREMHVSRAREKWMVDGKVDRGRLSAYLKRLGLAGVEEYDAFLREEWLGEQYVALEFPEADIDEADVRRRHAAMNRTLVVRALTFAPETLDESYEVSRDDPEHLEHYRKWWATLSENGRRIYDDLERPAVEAEVLFVNFAPHTVESFETFFLEPRGEDGQSLADLTRDIEVTPWDASRMYSRWTQFRKSHMYRINRAAPPGSNDSDSFGYVREHLVRECKTIKLLGRLWKELSASEEEVDLEAVAKRHGLNYRYIPLTPTRLMAGDREHDGELRGDHPIHLRHVPPGKLFDYGTNPSNPSSIYYTEGVVDQPGYHASIWKVVRAEEMRVLTAEQAIPRAWKDFERVFRWKIAEKLGERFQAAYEQLLRRRIEEYRQDEDEPADATAVRAREAGHRRRARRETFDEAVALAQGARLVGPFYVKVHPSHLGHEGPKHSGPLGRRISNLLKLEWLKVGGPVSTAYEKGDVLPLRADRARRLMVMLRVEDVIEPPEGAFERDAMGRRLAHDSLVQEREIARRKRILLAYAFPNVVHKFKMKAPQLEKVMAERK